MTFSLLLKIVTPRWQKPLKSKFPIPQKGHTVNVILISPLSFNKIPGFGYFAPLIRDWDTYTLKNKAPNPTL